MLNRDIKQRFLSECYPGKIADRYKPFLQLEVFEDQFGRDIAEMTIEEAQAASVGLSNAERGTTTNYLGVIKSYLKWCEDNRVFQNFDGGFYAVKVVDIDPVLAIRDEVFKDEDDFLRCLGEVRNLSIPRNDITAAILSWIGVSTSDMVSLRPEDFDMESRVVSVRNGETKAFWTSDAIHRLISRALEATSGPTVFGKPVGNQTASTWLYRMKSSRFRGENIQRSGGLYRLWCAERDGVDILSRDNRDLMLQIYGVNKQSNRVAWLYEAYKRAFNL